MGAEVALVLALYTAAKEGARLPSLERLAFVFSGADPAVTRGELSKASALVAMSLLSLSLVAGPLHRLTLSPRVLPLLRERRRLGVAAFVFAAAHAAVSLGSFRTLLPDLLRSNGPWRYGLAASAPALAVLWLMAITSTRRSKARLGAARWKRLHRLGALALALVVVHLVCMETQVGRGLHVRTYGLLVLARAVLVLGVRALALVVEARRRPTAPTRRRPAFSVGPAPGDVTG